MSPVADFEADRPHAGDLAERLLEAAAGSSAPVEFLPRALQLVLRALDADYAVLARNRGGQWNLLAAQGRESRPPWDLVADAMDDERVVQRTSWWCAPLRLQAEEPTALVVHAPRSVIAGPRVQSTASSLDAAWTLVGKRHAERQRAERLAAILDLVAEWTRTRETDALLRRMAEASTRLLDCERASIFLWDRPNRVLIARPALGVAGGELRIPDDKGIVGQVVQSGQPRRVDRGQDQGQIDRTVDQQLQFRTDSLLCVPLLGAGHRLFGAFELINKRSGQFSDADQEVLLELARHAAVALENSQHYEQLLRTRDQLAAEAAAGLQLIGDHPAIVALRAAIRRVADTDLTVLLLGENGTGKEVVSRLIHYWSRRRSEPFIAVNCAAMPEPLLESELFGHEKGAFTDAHESRMGKFELAAGGTLFLDEIGDLSLGGQAKLLRVLESKSIVRVGGSISIATDARVITATTRDLPAQVRAAKFREDLFFRLHVVALELPPLRQRGADIVLLAEHFLRDFSAKARRPPPTLTATARERLTQHAWPGNVRELRNLMERLAFLHTTETIDAHDLTFVAAPLPQSGLDTQRRLSLMRATRDFQMDYIRYHIEAAGGNVAAAARRLGLHRANLYRKMQQLGMRI